MTQLVMPKMSEFTKNVIVVGSGVFCLYVAAFSETSGISPREAYKEAWCAARLLAKGYCDSIVPRIAYHSFRGDLRNFDKYKIAHAHGMLEDDEMCEFEMLSVFAQSEFEGLEGDELDWLISGFEHDGDEHLFAYAEDNGYNPQSLITFVHNAVQVRDEAEGNWVGRNFERNILY